MNQMKPSDFSGGFIFGKISDFNLTFSPYMYYTIYSTCTD